jgi:hypothetical protein
VSEGRVSEIVSQCRRLGQILVESESPRDDTRDLRHLQGVRQSRAVVVARGSEEDLRLVHQPSEGLRMNDAVAVALKFGAVDALHIRMIAPLRVRRQKSMGRERHFLSLQKDVAHIAHRTQTSFVFSVFSPLHKVRYAEISKNTSFSAKKFQNFYFFKNGKKNRPKSRVIQRHFFKFFLQIFHIYR